MTSEKRVMITTIFACGLLFLDILAIVADVLEMLSNGLPEEFLMTVIIIDVAIIIATAAFTSVCMVLIEEIRQ